MMSENALYVILTVLTFSVALNLKLTFYLLRALKTQSMTREPPFTLPIGDKVPVLLGRALGTRHKVSFPVVKKPTVLVFLLSGCPKCNEKLPEISRLVPLLDNAGLQLWFVSSEPAWRITRFLKEQPLLQSVTVRISASNVKAINPTVSSPYYVFIDELGELKAAGSIGDDDWQSFRSQMDEINGELV